MEIPASGQKISYIHPLDNSILRNYRTSPGFVKDGFPIRFVGAIIDRPKPFDNNAENGRSVIAPT